MHRLMTSLVLAALLGLRLSATETVVPLGVVYANEEAFFDLVYRNDTSSPVQIRQVKTDCDCVTILTHPATVAAGAVARIPCVYRSAVPGALRIAVEIIGLDHDQRLAGFKLNGFVAEKSWLVAAPEALARPPGDTLFVDVRDAGEFARAHLPHSLNMPVFSLKTRVTLRARRIVLLDEGASPAALLSEVQTLRAQGFQDVAVLVGGLSAWLRAGGIAEGEEKSAGQLAQISAARYAAAQVTHPWLCFELGDHAESEKPAAGVLHAHDIPDLERKLAEWAWPVAGGLPFRPVMILADNVQDRALIENRLGRNQQLYYLAGGRDALAAHQAEQIALGRHTGQTFVAQSVVSPAVSRRCGTCGK